MKIRRIFYTWIPRIQHTDEIALHGDFPYLCVECYGKTSISEALNG